MQDTPRISHNGRRVPLVAVFGTRGGVGKSTICQYMAELVLSAPGPNEQPPSVLLIDLDVNGRQLTRHYAESNVVSECPTFHELVQLGSAKNVSAINVTSLVERQHGKAKTQGQLYFIPSASRQHVNAYLVGAQSNPAELRTLLSDIIQEIVDRHNVSCVIIDCTAIVDMYTAVAADIADVALCVSLAEAKAFDRIDEQAERIQSICSDFSPNRLKPMLNKYRRVDRIDQLRKVKDVFHAIPFTTEVVDKDEGFENIDELRLAIFKDYIVQLLEHLFRHQWPELVPPPSVTVPPGIALIAHVAPYLRTSKPMKRLSCLQHLRPAGVVILAIATIGLIWASRLEPTPPSSRAETEPLVVAKSVPGHPDESAEEPLNVRQNGARWQVSNASILGLLVGGTFLGAGWWASRRYREMCAAIDSLQAGGVVWIMRQLESNDVRQRHRVGRLLRLARRLPQAEEYLRSVLPKI